MKIKLHEIPQEGREYHYTRETGELNEVLSDLITNFPYDAKFSIRPLNTKDYTLTGTIKTHTKELCSLCGETIKFKTDANLNEILIPKPKDDSEGRYSRSNHVSEHDDTAPGVTEYDNDVFEVGEFLHQAIALTVPFSPKPEIQDDGSCKVCLKTIQPEAFMYDEKMGEDTKPNPFAALKGLKLN